MSDEATRDTPPVLSAGLRPFFLVAGGYAVLAMAAWMAWLALHSVNAVVVSPTIAVAAHLEPEVLIVDEVLAVGDAGFQRKCLGKMGEVARHGRTVVFVSHNMGAVRSLCSRVALLEKGRLVALDRPAPIIKRYLQPPGEDESAAPTQWRPEGLLSDATNTISLAGVDLHDQQGQPKSHFSLQEQVEVTVRYRVHQPVNELRVCLQLQTSEGVAAFTTVEDRAYRERSTLLPGEYSSRCTIPAGLLNVDVYQAIVAFDQPTVRMMINATPTLRLPLYDIDSYERFQTAPPGAVRPHLQWNTVLAA